MAQDIVTPLTEAALDVDSARRLLGQAPALLPGVPVQRVTQAQDGIVVEQQLASGAVVRLYERPAQDIRPSPAAKIAQQRSALPAPAFGAAQAGGSPAGERLARYVGSLRVEITGPLPEDSLSRLLELVK